MKNYKKTIILTIALCICSSLMAQAGKLTIINKIPDQRVQLFIRGEGSNRHHVELIAAGQQKDLFVEAEHVDGKPTFEVIADTGNGGDPDWKLLGGKCGELVTVSDHTIVVDSIAGKTTCTNKTAENPRPAVK